MVARHVVIQLLLSDFFYKFGEGRDNGDGAIVGCLGRATGFVDWMNDGVFPGSGKFTGCETGVDNEEKDLANSIKTELEDPDANTVRASGRRVFHRKESGLKVTK